MWKLPGRLVFTAGLFHRLWSPLGASLICEVGHNICHGAAARLDRRADQLRWAGTFLDRFGTAILRVADTKVEGRTSSGRPRPAQHRGSREPFGPTDIGASASGRRPVASSKRSCHEGRSTGPFHTES